MTELLTAAQMRAIEQAAIESGETTGLELMERAGAGVVEAVFEEWPELGDGARRAVVLCGPGNNGGDGFVVARLLAGLGWDVEVFLYGDPTKLPPDAKSNHDLWVGMGAVAPLNVASVSNGRRPVLMIDAMFGTGLNRAIPLECALAHHAVRNRDVGDNHPWLVPFHVVAVDCPSGMDCDSGHILMPEYPTDIGDDVDAHWRWWKEDASKRLLQTDLTVTFHRRKVGHYLERQSYALRVVDIGLGEEDRRPAHLRMTRDPEVACLLDFDPTRGGSRRMWPYDLVVKRPSEGRHKFDHGHSLVLTGGAGRTGAARLAARGALRIGAGLVTLGVPPSAQMEVTSQITALMLVRVGDGDALNAVLEDERINALCLGPGLGVHDRAAALVDAVLGGGHLRLTRHAVFDADALTLIAEDSSRMDSLNEQAVLTPHGGEFARLFPDIAEKLSGVPDQGPAYSKVDATRDAAARCGAIVLLKGPDTVIAHPDGRCSVHAAVYGREAPWLATAGAGDVLAGFITGLLARGLDPMEASETAAWLHAECARAFGPGLIAEDLPEILPQVLRDLGA
ncbi:NAD(P)H-hydrate dehydratase [uncultured Tateyamaria sp.]|uniref:NAD(P)H-hydrate dehydratase n=1 Tax=uncultured Tateyamaria sp. TaxID=455651 RepID=UPI00260B2795|nr:NAD(P)H-hydrate dehydratase [uncultured Tateyamaria sp.]